jgi:hypothetical protein
VAEAAEEVVTRTGKYKKRLGESKLEMAGIIPVPLEVGRKFLFHHRLLFSLLSKVKSMLRLREFNSLLRPLTSLSLLLSNRNAGYNLPNNRHRMESIPPSWTTCCE